MSFLKDTESFKSMIACQVNLSASVIAHYKSKFMKTSSALEERKKKEDRVEFDYLDQAVSGRLLTDAVPLLFDAGVFACCVSTLGRFTPL